jgi:hypothetical protein
MGRDAEVERFCTDEEPENDDPYAEDNSRLVNDLNNRLETVISAWKKAAVKQVRLGDVKKVLEEAEQQKLSNSSDESHSISEGASENSARLNDRVSKKNEISQALREEIRKSGLI